VFDSEENTEQSFGLYQPFLRWSKIPRYPTNSLWRIYPQREPRPATKRLLETAAVTLNKNLFLERESEASRLQNEAIAALKRSLQFSKALNPVRPAFALPVLAGGCSRILRGYPLSVSSKKERYDGAEHIYHKVGQQEERGSPIRGFDLPVLIPFLLTGSHSAIPQPAIFSHLFHAI